MKINKINSNNLRNSEHFQFHTEFRDIINKKGAENLKVKSQFDAYMLIYNKLDGGLKKINKSVLTSKIQEADALRDEIWSGLVKTNEGATKHFDSVIREAAERLKIVFDTYGNIAVKTINEQTSDTNNILQELEGKYTEDVKTVGVERWVAELKSRNAVVDSLVKERYEEAEDKSYVVVRATRLELDKAYRVIVERLNSFAVVADDVSVYESFIKIWNAVVVKYGGKYTQAGSATESTEPTEPVEPEPIDPFANAREWTRLIKAGDFKLGDIFYIAEPNVPKKYYELIDEEHYNYFPNSDEGALSWKRLV